MRALHDPRRDITRPIHQPRPLDLHPQFRFRPSRRINRPNTRLRPLIRSHIRRRATPHRHTARRTGGCTARKTRLQRDQIHFSDTTSSGVGSPRQPDFSHIQMFAAPPIQATHTCRCSNIPPRPPGPPLIRRVSGDTSGRTAVRKFGQSRGVRLRPRVNRLHPTP